MKHSFNSMRSLRFIYAATALLTLGVTATQRASAQVGAPNAWGSDQYGQLGDGGTTNVSSAELMSKLSGVIQIAGGSGHSLAVTNLGKVWACGHNDSGQLGDGTTTDNGVPARIASLKGIAQVAAGTSHSLALKNDGTVWAWGLNASGQLGNGANANESVPVQVKGLTKVVQIAAGALHSLALKSDGTVWVWGDNAYLQLGIADRKSRNAPVQMTTLKGMIQVAGGTYHSLALKSDGTVWAWGTNNTGQIGDGTTFNFRLTPNKVVNLTGVAQISSTAVHCLALKFDGTVWAWGYGPDGELGDGGSVDSNVPVQTTGITNAIQVTAGGVHSMALLSDGTLQAWGGNSDGQLGDGSVANSLVPIAVSTLTGQTYISAGASHSFSLIAVAQDVKVSATAITQQYARSISLAGTLGSRLTGLPLLQQPLDFNLNGTDLGSAYTIASGKATLIAPNSPQYTVGTYPIAVSFAGNGLYNPATLTVNLTVVKADTKIQSANVNAMYGQNLAILATLSRSTDGAKLVSQTLTFKLDGATLGTATTVARGRATFDYRIPDTLALGAHTLEVDFAGDANHNASSQKATITVAKATASLIMTNPTASYGAKVTLSALLRRDTDHKKLANQPLTFKLDGATLATVNTGTNGTATFIYKIADSLTPGAHTVEADFAGDSVVVASKGSAVLTVAAADTTLIMLDSTAVYGQTMGFASVLSRNTDKEKLAGQTVSVLIDGVQIGQGTTDSKGRATVAYTLTESLAPGAHTLQANFAGTTQYNASTVTATLTMNQTATKLTATSNSGKVGDTINLLSKLKRNSDSSGVVSRTIHYLIDGTEVGTAVTDSTGTATFAFTIPATLTVGKHTLATVFDGDAYYLASSSNTATLTVN